MLMASSSTMVGAMNSQAMPRSESPRRRRPKAGGVASARRPITEDFSAISLIGSGLDRFTLLSKGRGEQAGQERGPDRVVATSRAGRSRAGGSRQNSDLPFVLEDLGPVLDELVERFLGGG